MNGIRDTMLSEISQSQKNKGNVFPDKWRMIYNGGGGGGEWEKNGGTLDYVEGNEREGVWKMVEWDRHHYPMHMYDNMSGMNLHHVQP